MALLATTLWLAAGGGAAAQDVEFNQVAVLPGPADLVELNGRRAYVAAANTLTIFDLSDVTAPRRHGSYTFPEKIWGFVVIDSLVYVAADFFGLGILDVSDPDAPALLGAVKTPGQAKDVDVSGTTAVLADHMSGVDLIDVSDSHAPASLGSVYLDGYSRDVAVLGPLAYAVDDPSGFYVLDLAQTDSWEPLSAIQSADGPRIVQVSADAPRPLAVLLGHGTLQVYDLSTPTETGPPLDVCDAWRRAARGARRRAGIRGRRCPRPPCRRPGRSGGAACGRQLQAGGGGAGCGGQRRPDAGRGRHAADRHPALHGGRRGARPAPALAVRGKPPRRTETRPCQCRVRPVQGARSEHITHM